MFFISTFGLSKIHISAFVSMYIESPQVNIINIGDFCADSNIDETSNPLLIEKYSIILAHLKGHNA